jgi:hypothetical protein
VLETVWYDNAELQVTRAFASLKLVEVLILMMMMMLRRTRLRRVVLSDGEKRSTGKTTQ